MAKKKTRLNFSRAKNDEGKRQTLRCLTYEMASFINLKRMSHMLNVGETLRLRDVIILKMAGVNINK